MTDVVTLIGITRSSLWSIGNWPSWRWSLSRFLMVSAVKFSRRGPRVLPRNSTKYAELSGYLQDSLSGHSRNHGFNRPCVLNGNDSTPGIARSAGASQGHVSVVHLFTGDDFSRGHGTVLILWVGSMDVAQGNLKVGELVMFVSYLALFYVPVNQIHSVNHMLQHALASSERILKCWMPNPTCRDRPGVGLPPPGFTEACSSKAWTFPIIRRCRSCTMCPSTWRRESGWPWWVRVAREEHGDQTPDAFLRRAGGHAGVGRR